MSEPKVARLRLRSVKLKSGGGEIRVLHGTTRDDEARYAEDRLKKVIAAHDERIAGFAMVVWAPDGASTALTVVNETSKMPSILVPDFVRNRLLADTIERWTRS